ncbi:MAG: hypothetical protein ABW009_15225, partial [Acidimicrobiales bacterium]
EPFRPDDDLVSAVLDGEATEDERARVAADPVLAARLAEFAAAADQVAALVAPRAAADRDRAITAAVAERPRRDDVVVAMRGPHRRHSQHILAVAAAVLVVLLAAGFLIAQVGDDAGSGNDTAAIGSDDSASDAESASDTAAAAGDAEDGDAAAFEDTATYDLGAVANDEAVRNALVAAGAVNQSTLSADDGGSDAVTDTTVASVPEAAPVPGGSDDCQIRLEEADPSLDGRLVEASATFAGDPAVVYVFGTADGGRQVTVVTADTCVTLASFPL